MTRIAEIADKVLNDKYPEGIYGLGQQIGEAKYLVDQLINHPEQLVKLYLKSHTDQERVEFFKAMTEDYCEHCGCKDPHCPCWNDE